MSITSMLFFGVGFLAGAVAGVFLAENDIVTCKHLEQGGQVIIDTTRAALSQFRSEPVRQTVAV